VVLHSKHKNISLQESCLN